MQSFPPHTSGVVCVEKIFYSTLTVLELFQRVSGAISIFPGQTTVPLATEAFMKSGKYLSFTNGFLSR
jgi:hypothetical protein